MHSVVFLVRLHLDGAGYTVGHIIKTGDIRNVPNIFLTESVITQTLPVGFADLMGCAGKFIGEIQHSAMARFKVGGDPRLMMDWASKTRLDEAAGTRAESETNRFDRN